MCKTLKDLIINKNDSIDIRDCYKQTGIEDILGTLDKELVGLGNVKTRVKEISSVLLFDRIREIQELPVLNSSLHMAFTGRPGTGKTSVAAKIGLVLRNLGYLTKGHVSNVTREDLVGQYVGHTAPKTREQLQKARGGILFIDEAHHLYKPDNERDYGSEARAAPAAIQPALRPMTSTIWTRSCWPMAALSQAISRMVEEIYLMTEP